MVCHDQLEKYLISPQIWKLGYSGKFFWISPNNRTVSLGINFLSSHDTPQFTAFIKNSY